MSKKNKCVGLDCEMCDNTKCPNEEKEKIIDGIDVSESVLTATNNNIYYSQIAVDELQNNIKHLQEENEELKADLKGETEQCQKWYQLETDKHFQMLKYRKALEEIRKKITSVCAYCDNIDGFTIWDDCENVCEKGVIKYLKIIDEVLNDRD